MARFARLRLRAACILLPLLAASAVQAQNAKYDPGADDKTIKIGTTAPLSGPVSAFAQIAKSAEAYFRKVNDEGGVNGRRIQMIIADDAYSPPKTVEQTRRLVESEEVLLIFGGVGTPTNSAVHKYLNDRKVPQLFLGSGAAKWDDPKNFPWTVGWQPTYRDEAIAYAKYIKANHANAKIGVLYQNDDLGKDYLKALEEGLGSAEAIVARAAYETSAPTVDTQILQLKTTGADVVLVAATPKFAAQAIRKIGEIGWKPVTIISNVSASISGVLEPAGKDNSTGVISSQYLKDATDPASKDDAGYKEWLAFMDKYLPDANKSDWLNVYGYTIAQTLVTVLKASGNDLTRANVMKQATTLRDVKLPMLINGTAVNNSPEHYTPMTSLQLIRFDGTRWVPFGDLLKN
ncbi:ABC transporter substrate-binding protein [Bradyrhizobium japonicum]|uniref:Branched-chain amino acid transport system substrate-binding protein n=1 Tax=Bradyrhizobium japonicum TaxID=375 RepID=A0ABV2S581_BRAJP|nr:ABC transporter substrate-binding protein [Bradyrhizobium japonicum]MCP1759306.1 ABC-type branched-subunit amino acid transport system substrate-binding protein [Bradyrhizobium japonicum]MCP1790815.1 ABC-type branched-subunit amino acid transport system substrate-binding protein [Bradyrhizobium japonicum]MCP1803315.1 ABC-type branched-subunit amino acid transport system substrate-binding protein [Bradyrhizobium japonicum]MCP1812249.1 ABC-type branched-subunit amino acid transport system subs